jgi:23S rRNA pseudouridine1911/1915/1917 synthase
MPEPSQDTSEDLAPDAESADDLRPLDLDADGLETTETALEADEDGLQHVRINIRRALPNRRLDKYLSGRLGKDYSRTAIQRYIREGMVTVDGRAVKPSYVIRTADTIDMTLPVVRQQEIPPEPIPLNVVYEDDDVLAISKQADLIIHPARGNWTGTLVNGLAYYFQSRWRDEPRPPAGVGGRKPTWDAPTSGEIFRPGIVHRLDRDTTGIMLVAKTQLALWRLGRQFELREVRKVYNAIVHGILDRDEDVIEAPIGRHPRTRELRAVYRGAPPYPAHVKDAVTRYKVLRRIGGKAGRPGFTLVEMGLMTGRTHQLRVHMAHVGHPMVGDTTYGGRLVYRLNDATGDDDTAAGPLIARQALHARTIEFYHPRTRERMTVEAPWPEDFATTLKELQRRYATV